MTIAMDSFNIAIPKIVIETLREVLERENSLSRCSAVRALEKMEAGDRQSISKLIDALHDNDPDVCMDAARALGNLNIEDALLPLIDILRNDPHGEVRIEAVTALGKIRSKKALDVLIECLKNDGYLDIYDGEGDDMEFAPAWEIQSRSLDALGELGDERAVGHVIELLKKEEYEDMQEKGFRALAKLSGFRAKGFLLEQLEKGGSLARRRAAGALSDLDLLNNEEDKIDAAIFESLGKALLDEDPNVRISVARALGAIKSPQVVAPLTMLLSDTNSNVIETAVEILGKMRGKAVTDRLIKLMSDSTSPYVIAKILEVLGHMGSPENIEVINMYLSVEDRDLNHAAVVALGEIGHEGPQVKIACMLDDEKMDNNIRVQAATALGKILKGKGFPHEADDESGETLAGEGDESLDHEIEPVHVLMKTAFDKKDNVSVASMSALAEIDREESVEILSAILLGRITYEATGKCNEEEVPQNVLPIDKECHAEMGSGGEFPPNADIAMRKEEVSTLASIMASQASSEGEEKRDQNRKLEAAAESLQREQRDLRVRLVAARLLGESNSDKAIESLMSATGLDNPEIRKEAIVSLGRIGDEKSLPLILEGLESGDRDVRLASIDALRGFGEQALIKEKLHILINDPDYFVRERVLSIVSTLGGAVAVDMLSKALDDEQMVVKRAALNWVTEDNETGELARKIMNVLFDHGGELRYEAARALRRLKGWQSVQMLLDRLKDSDYEEYHWICIDALAEYYSTDKS